MPHSDSDSSIRLYMHEIAKTPLLTPEEEIKLPIHLVDKLARIRRISALMAETLGRDPSDRELSEELGIPRHKLALIRQAAKGSRSLDAPNHHDQASTFGETP